MATPPVPDSSYEVARSNLETLDKYINNTYGTVTNRDGQNLTPIPVVNSLLSEASDVAANAIIELPLQIARLGLQYPPIPYTSGLTLDSNTKTYSYNDALYIWGGALGTITTGTFNETGWQPIQGDVQLRNDVTKGTSLIRDVKHLSGIFELGVVVPQYDGQQFSVAGFYVDTVIGGGLFVWDASRSKADHNGGTVIAPEAVAAWNGTHADLSALLNWTGSGTGCYVKEINDDTVNISEFGAFNGAENSLSMNKLSTAIKNTDLKVGIDVKSDITNPVVFYNSTKSSKKITVKNLAYISILRSVEAIPLTPILANMVRGQAVLGYSGYLGATVVVRSEEKLIDRVGNDGGELFYKKEEVAEVVSDSGVIQPYWLNTYTTLTGLTVNVYPKENDMSVNLDIEYDQTNVGNFSVIKCIRSNCDLRGVKISVVGDKTLANVGVFINDAVNVNVNEVKIEGFQSTLGYGIHQLRTANVNINDTRVTECRRPVANRFDKNTWVRRGFYRSSGAVSCIDSHWGDGVHVREIQGYCKGKNALDFAGYNASVKDCELLDVLYVIGNRPDTPVWGGSIVAENNDIKSTRGLFAYFGSQSIGEDYSGAFDWVLPWPNLMKARNNTVNITNVNWSMLRLNDSRFDRTQIGKILIEENNYLNDVRPTGLVQLGCRALDTHPDYVAEKASIIIRHERFAEGSGSGILDIEQHGATWKWNVTLENVADLYFRIDCDIANKVKIDGGNFIGARTKTFRTESDPDRVQTFYFELNRVNIASNALLYSSANQIIASNCIFESGSLTYSMDSSDSKPISTDRYTAFVSSMSNVALKPVSNVGSLPPLDGWVNTDVAYTRQAVSNRNSGAMTASQLGKNGLGYNETTNELLVVNSSGIVRKIATT